MAGRDGGGDRSRSPCTGSVASASRRSRASTPCAKQDDYAGVWWLNAAKPADGSPGFEGVERALVELGAIFIRGLE